MTDYKSTIAELHYLADWAKHHLDKAKIANDAADAIEALQEENALLEGTLESRERNIAEMQAENERLKVESTNKNDWLVEQRKWEAHANALQAKLDAMGKGEPVAHRAWFDADNGARWLFTLWPEEEKLDVEWEPLYAAPKALPSLTDEPWMVKAIDEAYGITKGTSA